MSTKFESNLSHRGFEDNLDVIGEADGRESDFYSVPDRISLQIWLFRDGPIANEGVSQLLVLRDPDDIII